MQVAIIGNGQLASCLRNVVAPDHRLVAPAKAELLWVAVDTLVAGDGTADLDSVRGPALAAFKEIPDDAVVLVSSQVPPGFTRELRRAFYDLRPTSRVEFAYMVENIKAGSGPDGWRSQLGFIVGLFDLQTLTTAYDRVFGLLKPWPGDRTWLAVESAELTKLAINTMLATITTVANEVGDLAPLVGAHTNEIGLGLKADKRLQHCPVLPGGGFGREHLGRDLKYLIGLAGCYGKPMPLTQTVWKLNEERLTLAAHVKRA